MNRGVNDGFEINTQSQLLPVLATSIKVILELHSFYMLLCMYVPFYVFLIDSFAICLVSSYVSCINAYYS